MTTTSTEFARETDTALAERWHELGRAESLHATLRASVIAATRPRYYYRGKRRMTDRTFEEAAAMCREWLKSDRFALISAGADRIERLLDGEIDEAAASIEKIREQIAELEERYTGWSRFFLVTSSAGHIHSSMHCSTCRPTTTYGWLPELSGLTEAEAVAAHGPALCSVCFSSAPTEWIGGKLTKAQAERAAA